MRRFMRALVAVASAFSCASCGLFLDDFSKGGAQEDGGADIDTDADGGTGDTPCDGVDLAVEPWCNLEDSWLYSYFPQCDCPTCPWDAIDCDTTADAGAGDASADDAGPDTDGDE